jgi:hypothetical protein
MKQITLATFLVFIQLCLFAQHDAGDLKTLKKEFGFRAGVNIHSMNGLKSFDGIIKNQTGFVAGGFYALPSKGIGYRTEFIFSRQGYQYQNSAQAGTVMYDYILLPQLATLNISRFFQLHAGGQVAILLNSKVDSSANPSSQPDLSGQKNYFNRLNYGAAAGLEIKPVAGLLIGARYNLFFKLLTNLSENEMPPAYLPDYRGNLKNGLMQLYIGCQF